MKKKSILIITLLLSVLFLAVSVNAFAAEWTPPTTQDIKDNQGIIYFVNCSKEDKTETESWDRFGLYQSVLDKSFGEDATTGYKWGRDMLAEDYGFTGEESNKNKYQTNVYAKSGKDIKYKFEVEPGIYNVTIGYQDLSWGNRTTSVYLNGENRGNVDMLWNMYRQFNYPLTVTESSEGESFIDLKLTKADEKQADPYLSFIIIRKVVENDRFFFAERMFDTKGEVIQAHGGAIYEYEIEGVKQYYWYGEDKTDYVLPYEDDGTMAPIYNLASKKYGSYSSGVRLYTSTDLYNWEDKGTVLKPISHDNDVEFAAGDVLDENKQYFKDLYGEGADKLIPDDVKHMLKRDLHKGRSIIERPKVIYNKKTDKYVMWFHADGPIDKNMNDKSVWHSYWKQSLAVAISDTPYGPFKYDGLRELHADKEHYDYWAKQNVDDEEKNYNVGGGRDMTLYLDDDGKGYVIYASEGNASEYISRLNDDFTDVVTTAVGGNYGQGVPGIDYVNAIPKSGREAPALFKYNKKYYMITSGLTGWDPNPAQYHMADNIFGPWIAMGDPCVNDSAGNTFYSQSTNVFPVNAANGEFFYMGDRWYNPSNQGDIDDSRYIWLPIEFESDGRIKIKVVDEWNLNDLKDNGIMTIAESSALPKLISLGDKVTLPSSIKVHQGSSNEILTSAVTWKTSGANLDKIGTSIYVGTLTDLGNKEVIYKVMVVPNKLNYFVNCGINTDDDFNLIKDSSSIMVNTTQNQAFDGEWGYDPNVVMGNKSGSDIYGSFSYVQLSSPDRNMKYKFNLEKGVYNFYFGFYDPWSERNTNVLINGNEVIKGHYVSGDSSVAVGSEIKIDVEGLVDVEIEPTKTGANTDVLLSFIMIQRVSTLTMAWETEPTSKVYDGEAVTYLATSENGNNEEIVYTKQKFVSNEWKDFDGDILNAGKYRVIATLGDNSIEKTVEIYKAALEIKAEFSGSLKFGDALPTITTTTEGGAITLDANQTLKVGTNSYLWTWTPSDTENYLAVNGRIDLTVGKGVIDVSGITFADGTFTFDGLEKSLAITGELPEGVTVDYLNNARTKAGETVVTLVFNVADLDNYEQIESKNAKIIINKAVYDMSGVKFESAEFAFDGSVKNIAVSGTLPEGVTVTYKGNGQLKPGEYEVTAMFSGDAENYESISDMSAKIKITGEFTDDVVTDDTGCGSVVGTFSTVAAISICLIILIPILKRKKRNI